jgi:NADPH-dependent 2,4-dienoyl-CoA reductase/sulfur reductase-like enzyme
MDDENLRIVILGAGPIGLEAALYARYLGYPTQLVETADTCAASVLALGNQSIDEFGKLASRLGVSALRAQDTDWQPPAASSVLTAAEWRERYLTPLAVSDLIADVLHLRHEVIGIVRRATEEDVSFEIRVRNAEGAESMDEADIVIDATGTKAPAWFGDAAVDEGLGFANPEADFYVLGAKAGAGAFADGLVQIRDLFAILGEREDLDVYATMPEIE